MSNNTTSDWLFIKDLKVGDVIRGVGGQYSPHYLQSGELGLVIGLTSNSALLFTMERSINGFVSDHSHGMTPIATRVEDSDAKKFLKALKAQYTSSKCGFHFSKRLSSAVTGTDPEVFILDDKGKVIPAFNFLKGKDEDRLKDDSFWDGFQAEFNPPPAGCHQSLQVYIRICLLRLHQKAKEYNPKAVLKPVSVVDVSKDELETLPDQFVALGCMASLNAYGEPPLEVLDPRSLLYRTVGCHIHFGIGRSRDYLVPEIVRTIDSIAGVAMTSLFQGMEDPRRRVLYGRAGEYRLPEHGLEWRVPPAEVLCHPVVYMLCFDLARAAMAFGALGFGSEWKADSDEVREIINQSDYKGAQKILKKNQKVLKGLLGGIYEGFAAKNAHSLILSGAKNWLPVNDFTENWKLNCPEQFHNVPRPKPGWQVNHLEAR